MNGIPVHTGVLLFSLLFLPVVSAQTVDELIPFVDPARDDWASESFQKLASSQLKHLAGTMSGSDVRPAEELFVPDARATSLRPEPDERRALAGGLQVARTVTGTDLDRPAATAVRELAAFFAGFPEPRLKFKIVGVEGDAKTGWTTRVRFEAALERTPERVQLVASWEVRWAAEPVESPRIAAIRLETSDEVRSASPVFVDATRSVVPDALWDEQLAFGGEYWHGRIDAIGEPYLMGHQGIAVGDFDGNGLEDLYVAMGNGLPNRLLVQQDDGSVRDVAEQAGLAWLDDTKGVLMADMDNDGDQDVLTAIGPTIVLCVNEKGKCSSFVSMRAPTPASYYSLSVADFDLDGDLDIFGARYVQLQYGVSVPMPFHDANNGPTNRLLRNDGENRYADVTETFGLPNNRRFSLIGAWGDYDGDGDPDLYVANDFGRNNLYRNDGDKFEDVAAEAGVEDQAAGMGVSWADYDLDGDLDLYVTNMFSAAGSRIAYQPRFKSGDAAVRGQIQHHAVGNTLLRNQGDGTFRDVSEVAGVRMGRWGWGSRFVDWNNDGYEDIVVPNGFLTGAIEDDL